MHKNIKGFTLLELIITALITSIFLLGISNIISNSLSSNKQKDEIISELEAINMLTDSVYRDVREARNINDDTSECYDNNALISISIKDYCSYYYIENDKVKYVVDNKIVNLFNYIGKFEIDFTQKDEGYFLLEINDNEFDDINISLNILNMNSFYLKGSLKTTF